MMSKLLLFTTIIELFAASSNPLSDSEALSAVIQERLARLQNPENCASARKLVCDVGNCGYGCRVHSIGICLVVAYVTKRTMVLEMPFERNYNDRLWDDIFQPWSTKCFSNNGTSHAYWGSGHCSVSDTSQVLKVPPTHRINPNPEYVAHVAIPQDLASRMVKVTSDPGAWWIGQIMKYVMRLQPQTKLLVDKALKKVNVTKGPIVGIQVRRTDKLKYEARLQPLYKYMVHVRKFFDTLDAKRAHKAKVQRRVFIATDEPAVLKKARMKYKDYQILTNHLPVKMNKTEDRYNRKELDGVIMDTHILANCDFVVCTFSSNLCRLVYEMKLARDPMAATKVVSLDQRGKLRVCSIEAAVCCDVIE